MKYVIDLKTAVIDQTTIFEQLELATYLLERVFDYSDMYIDDSDHAQYCRLLSVKNKLHGLINIVNSISSDDLSLS